MSRNVTLKGKILKSSI